MAMEFTDQMGRMLRLNQYPPKRIVSLVPSQTELLAALDLETEVAGITKFCIHPEAWYRSKTHVGGTKSLNAAAIEALQPDLIIGNKEENQADQINALATRFPVWMSDVYNLEGALHMMRALGQVCNREPHATALAKRISDAFIELEKPQKPLRAVYLIWRKPYIAVGAHTFIHDMLHRAGFENALGHLQRYPVCTAQQIAESRPDCILLSSEPFPFAEKHLPEFQQLCPEAAIRIVDGALFSWYGSRMLSSPHYFQQLWLSLPFDQQ